MKAVVQMMERGFQGKIEPRPWETATCLGDWDYLRGAAYKSAEEVLKLLVDVVSKNGVLLLSVPVRGDGTVDEREIAVLEELAAWMEINSEAIYGTRPWRVLAKAGR